MVHIRASYDTFRELRESGSYYVDKTGVIEDKEREMESALKEAGSQILDKKYESRLVYQGYRKRIQYAMAFCGKNCRIGEVTRMK